MSAQQQQQQQQQQQEEEEETARAMDGIQWDDDSGDDEDLGLLFWDDVAATVNAAINGTTSSNNVGTTTTTTSTLTAVATAAAVEGVENDNGGGGVGGVGGSQQQQQQQQQLVQQQQQQQPPLQGHDFSSSIPTLPPFTTNMMGTAVSGSNVNVSSQQVVGGVGGGGGTTTTSPNNATPTAASTSFTSPLGGGGGGGGGQYQYSGSGGRVLVHYPNSFGSALSSVAPSLPSTSTNSVLGGQEGGGGTGTNTTTTNTTSQEESMADNNAATAVWNGWNDDSSITAAIRAVASTGTTTNNAAVVNEGAGGNGSSSRSSSSNGMPPPSSNGTASATTITTAPPPPPPATTTSRNPPSQYMQQQQAQQVVIQQSGQGSGGIPSSPLTLQPVQQYGFPQAITPGMQIALPNQQSQQTPQQQQAMQQFYQQLQALSAATAAGAGGAATPLQLLQQQLQQQQWQQLQQAQQQLQQLQQSIGTNPTTAAQQMQLQQAQAAYVLLLQQQVQAAQQPQQLQQGLVLLPRTMVMTMQQPQQQQQVQQGTTTTKAPPNTSTLPKTSGSASATSTKKETKRTPRKRKMDTEKAAASSTASKKRGNAAASSSKQQQQQASIKAPLPSIVHQAPSAVPPGTLPYSPVYPPQMAMTNAAVVAYAALAQQQGTNLQGYAQQQQYPVVTSDTDGGYCTTEDAASKAGGTKRARPTTTKTPAPVPALSSTTRTVNRSTMISSDSATSDYDSTAAVKTSMVPPGVQLRTFQNIAEAREIAAEEKAEMNRERNREHAKNTRLRKKAYVERLKITVDELSRERDALVSERATRANLMVEIHSKRMDVLRSLFALRASYTVNQRRELWSSLLDECCFTCRLPVTPYQSFPSSEVQVSNCQRTIVGVDAMINDVACNAVFLDSIVDRQRFPKGKINFHYKLVTDETPTTGNRLMARWSMETLNAKQCGAHNELHQNGMLFCKFNSSHKIVSLEIMFDVMAFMLQVKMAMGYDNFNDVVIPNTVQTCTKEFYYPMVISSADRPYTITKVNERWEKLTGYKADEVVGKSSCSILQGEDTTKAELDLLMRPVLFKRPSCAMITNYTKSGRRFRSYLTLYPLSTDSKISHYLGLTTYVQWIDKEDVTEKSLRSDADKKSPSPKEDLLDNSNEASGGEASGKGENPATSSSSSSDFPASGSSSQDNKSNEVKEISTMPQNNSEKQSLSSLTSSVSSNGSMSGGDASDAAVVATRDKEKDENDVVGMDPSP